MVLPTLKVNAMLLLHARNDNVVRLHLRVHMPQAAIRRQTEHGHTSALSTVAGALHRRCPAWQTESLLSEATGFLCVETMGGCTRRAFFFLLCVCD
jgi:hypothetical protein